MTSEQEARRRELETGLVTAEREYDKVCEELPRARGAKIKRLETLKVIYANDAQTARAELAILNTAAAPTEDETHREIDVRDGSQEVPDCSPC